MFSSYATHRVLWKNDLHIVMQQVMSGHVAVPAQQPHQSVWRDIKGNVMNTANLWKYTIQSAQTWLDILTSYHWDHFQPSSESPVASVSTLHTTQQNLSRYKCEYEVVLWQFLPILFALDHKRILSWKLWVLNDIL